MQGVVVAVLDGELAVCGNEHEGQQIDGRPSVRVYLLRAAGFALGSGKHPWEDLCRIWG